MQHFLQAALKSMALVDVSLVVIFIYILFLIRQNHRANVFLGLFVICCASPLLFFVAPIGNKAVMGVFVCLTAAMMTVSGAFMYLYISFLAGDIGSVGKRELRHLLVFPAVFVLMLFFYFPLDPVSLSPRCPRVLSAAGPALISCVTVYAVLTFLKVRSYSRRVENWFSDPGKVSMNWLMAISFPSIALFLIWMLFSILVHFRVVSWGPAFILPQLSIIGLIPAVAIFYVIRQPEIFKANAELRKYEELDLPEDREPAKEKYAKQSIDDEKMKEYSASLNSCMQTQKPYLDEDLTIGQLAMITNVPVHHLSIVINSVFGKNFSSFISEYRIKEAISHMHSDPDANILSIAYRSGFNSKSSFNKTFKHITGKTPSQYRETVNVSR